MKDKKDKKDSQKQEKKIIPETRPSEKTDSPYIKLAIALEELNFDDFELEKDDET